MAEIVHGPAGHEIDILLAIGVPHPAILATHNDHRLPPHGLGIVLLLQGDPGTTCTGCVCSLRHTCRFLLLMINGARVAGGRADTADVAECSAFPGHDDH